MIMGKNSTCGNCGTVTPIHELRIIWNPPELEEITYDSEKGKTVTTVTTWNNIVCKKCFKKLQTVGVKP